MGYKQITKYEQYQENPFLDETTRSVKVVKRTQMMTATGKDAVHYVVNRESGEIDGYSSFMRVVEVDQEQFTKLYTSELAAIWDLSKPGIRVLTYVMSALIPNRDTIIFDISKCMEFTQYKTENSVTSGLADLVEHGIIARTKNYWEYFINPMVVFNGNRVAFAKMYIKKKDDSEGGALQLE